MPHITYTNTSYFVWNLDHQSEGEKTLIFQQMRLRAKLKARDKKVIQFQFSFQRKHYHFDCLVNFHYKKKKNKWDAKDYFPYNYDWEISRRLRGADRSVVDSIL